VTGLFEGFDDDVVDVGDVRIRARRAGSGPALLLLHGYPESSLMWRLVAPMLAEQFTVVVTDLRGYGRSSAPGDDAQHATYSKRSMAQDQVSVMEALGHRTFSVAGHDRGGRVAHRMVLDHPSSVERAAVLDIVPTLHMYDNVDREMAETYFHWFFLSRPAPLPEDLIAADPAAWMQSRFRGRHADHWRLEDAVLDEYLQDFADPAHLAATCADYRAASTIDLEHDREDRAAGRRISVPLLAVWGESSYVGRTFDVVGVWESYADQVTGCAAPSDHYVPEEAPEFTAQALTAFFGHGSRA
jgi:haloacetate dehalogenase